MKEIVLLKHLDDTCTEGRSMLEQVQHSKQANQDDVAIELCTVLGIGNVQRPTWVSIALENAGLFAA